MSGDSHLTDDDWEYRPDAFQPGRTLPLCGSTRGGSLPCPNTAPCPIHPKASGRTPTPDGPCQVEVEQTAWTCRTCARGQDGYPDRESAEQAARAHVEQIDMGRSLPSTEEAAMSGCRLCGCDLCLDPQECRELRAIYGRRHYCRLCRPWWQWVLADLRARLTERTR